MLVHCKNGWIFTQVAGSAHNTNMFHFIDQVSVNHTSGYTSSCVLVKTVQNQFKTFMS